MHTYTLTLSLHDSLPLYVHVLLVHALRDVARQVVQRQVGGPRQLRQAVGVLAQLLRVGPQRRHRRGHRQRLAVAVGDHAARGRNRDLAQDPRIGLLLVEGVVDQLQVHGAADQRNRAQAERADHQLQPPAQVELRAVAPGRPGFVVLEPRLEVPEHAREPAFAPLRIPPPRPRVPAPHGLITTMSAVSGNFIPSRVRAIWSMRLASAQVACSSCRRPKSMLSSSSACSNLASCTNSCGLLWRALPTPIAVTTLAMTRTLTMNRVLAEAPQPASTPPPIPPSPHP